MIFEPGITTLAEFADFIEEFRYKPCPQAVAWLREHDWDTLHLAPIDFAYHLLTEFLDVLGPTFRAGAISRVGEDPFWAARTWMTVRGLTDEEYHYLFARSYYRYRDTFGKRVLEGSLMPGRRAIV